VALRPRQATAPAMPMVWLMATSVSGFMMSLRLCVKG
jgi:hypothetical protein